MARPFYPGQRDYFDRLNELYNRNMASWSAESATSLTVGTGAQTLTVAAGLVFAPGQAVRIASKSDPSSVFMDATVVSYSDTTLVVEVSDTAGTGTHADWVVSVAGARGERGPSGMTTYQTAAEMEADVDAPQDAGGIVTNDPNPALNGWYRKVAPAGQPGWARLESQPVSRDGASEAGLDAVNDLVLTVQGKNLFDKSRIVTGEGFSITAGAIVANANYRRSNFIGVQPGESYALSGNQSNARTVAFYADADDAFPIGWIDSFTRVVVAPAGANYAVFNVTTEGGGVTIYDGTTQLEQGDSITGYEPFYRQVPRSIVVGGDDLVNASEIIDESSFNLINPAAVDFVNRYSTASKSMQVDTVGIAASAKIPVVEGELYTLSGAGIFGLPLNPLNCQGGYFLSATASSAIDNIAFFAPVTGVGAVFQVPAGLGITHVVVSLRKLNNSAAETTLHGPVQMERGEVPTAYRPYAVDRTIKPELLPATPPPPSGVFDARAWYTYTEGDEGTYLADKFPIFRSHWLKKDKDLCVVNVGTSLTARSSEHCTLRDDATRRPPLLHSNNLASILWDRMKWDHQQYRRYDDPGFFVESGAFSASFNLTEWDDGPYRNGLTRYSQATGAAVSFEVPVSAWQFNFIYRTDTAGVEANAIAVAEGNGQMEVFDGSAWVEANGYVFSMREASPVSRVISYPDASTDAFLNITTHSRGNTTYQKRLKMRCNSEAIDSRAAAKAVTITGQSAGRFLYWGVEWSIRQHMITYINAARGSHNTRVESATGLPRYADNEVWSFAPDLMLSELPIHNDGADDAVSRAGGYWWRLTNNYVFRDDYELSWASRAAHFGLAPEVVLHTSSVAYLFGGIDEDGQLILGEQGDGSMMTALDKFNQAFEWMKDTHPDVAIINSAKRWVDAGVAIFGDMRTATEGSGKDGATLTNEGGHWNDTGCKIVGKTLTPLLGFTN